MRILTAITITLVLFSCSESKVDRVANGPDPNYIYTYNRDSVRLDWTVTWKEGDESFTGTFDNVGVSAPNNTSTPAEALAQAAVEIYAPMINAGDVKLNSAIVEYLFGKSEEHYIIAASALSINGTESKGTVDMYLQLAGSTDTLVMDYTVNDDVLELWGAVDLVEMGHATKLEPLEEMYGEGKALSPVLDLYFITRFHKNKASQGKGSSISSL